MKRIPRRIFTAEFKRKAIKLVTEQGLTLAEASRKLDIATKSLRTWMDQQERGELKPSLGASKLTADQQRILELERELAIAKMERDILKKSDGVLREGVEVKYAMIDKLRNQHPVANLCALLDVAKSGYQAWSTVKVIPPRKLEDMRLLVAIRAAHQRGCGIYGPKKIRDELADQGIVAGLNRIKRLRTLHGIRCTHKKKFRVTTDSKHNLPVAPNLLDRQFVRTAPNQVWVADITYIPTDKGWLFLAAIKDLHTCEIVGWAMDSRMTKTLVVDALRAAYWRKKPKLGLMHHSDRGSQYCSSAYRALQVSYGMKTSMSRKGNCWGNAPMESFFGTIKTESLHHYRFATREQARQVVFEYIEVFYNHIRRHAKIGNQVPADFANQQQFSA